MAQVETYIKGKGKWLKIFAGQEDTEFKCWPLDLYLDEEQLAVFKSWNSELKLREDKDTAEPYIKLRRPTMKLIKDKLVHFDPPEVLSSDNGKWSGAKIGNGSELTCKVVVYDSKKGKGVRLEAVRVDVHVPFEGTEVDTSNVDSPF